MDKKLKKIVLEYMDEVERVCSFILEGLNLKSREDLAHHRIKNPYGEFELNGKNKYAFHGRGCWFSNQKISIDWDFGYDGKWCGLNPWLLADYIKEKKISDLSIYNEKRIEEEFKQALMNGEMKNVAGLYYFE